MDSHDFPDKNNDWGIVAIKLLQGVLYSEEDKSDWGMLDRHRDELQQFFARIGLMLVIDEPAGYAYLRQFEEDDDNRYHILPRLFRRSRLSYDATLISILLRQRLHEFDERLSNLDDERCAVEEDELFEDWKKLIPNAPDDKKLKSKFDTAMNRLKEIQFIKPIGEPAGRWEIRRIIKARLSLENMENLLQQLQEAYAHANDKSTAENEDDTIA